MDQSAAVPEFIEIDFPPDGEAPAAAAACASPALPGLLARFDPAAEQRAIFNGQPVGLHFPGHLPGAPQLHFVAPGNFSVYFSANDHFASSYVGLHLPVRPNGQASIREAQLAIHLAINKKILATCHFTFNLDSLADAGGGLRSCRCRSRSVTGWRQI